MLSATLDEGLRDYAIGAKIRALRLKKKMGLVELGRHSGLSPALLSKIERGRLYPTLPTLLRIALVFSVGLDYFFAGAREKPLVAVVRRAERVRLPERQDGQGMAYRFESLDYPATERRFNSYYAEFLPLPRDSVRLHTHAGVEFIYMMKGRLHVHVGGQEHALEAGDSMYFDSGLPHGYRRGGSSTCGAIVVTTA
jgi:transcriptional regulator with XRE-family HTH domain